jgi:hypothetical protein
MTGLLVGLACGCNTGTHEDAGPSKATSVGALTPAQTGAGAAGGVAAGPPAGVVGAPQYPGAGTGTVYYVDGATGNDANPGTQAQPWQTVDRLESQPLRPGDLIRVQAGTYDLDVNLQLDGVRGSSTAWIGLEADGAVVLRNSAVANVISVRDCAFLFLKGFEITHDNGGAAYGGWDGVDGVKFEQLNSENVAIDTCFIHDIGNVGVSSQVGEVRGLIVYGCEIADCYTGIYLGYYEDVNKRYAHFGRIARNYIHDCPPQDLDGTGYGIQIKGGSRGNVIEDNVLVDVAGSSRAGIAVYHVSTDQQVYTERNVLRRNLVHRSRGEGIYAAEGALIENNVIVDSGSVGIVLNRRDSGGWGAFYGNLEVRHNSVYRVNDPAGRGLTVGDSTFSAPFVISNNLLAVEGAGQLAARGPGTFGGTGSQNVTFGGTSGSGLGSISVPDMSAVQSTAFSANGFLRPAPGGALDDAGDPASATSGDYFEAARGSRPDVGAFEEPGVAVALVDGFKP